MTTTTADVARRFACFRIGLGVILLIQAIDLLPSMSALHGARGLLQAPIAEVLAPPLVPRIDEMQALLAPTGVDPLPFVIGAYLTSLLGFIAGYRVRWTARIAWAIQLVLLASTGPSAYGVTTFLRVAMFYAAWVFPVGAAWSVDSLQGRAPPLDENIARLSLLALRAHLMIAYSASGFEKSLGPDWWSGESIWRAVALDPGVIDMSWLPNAPRVALVLGLGTLALELGYAPLAAWRRTRPWLLAAICSLHAGIALALGLWVFAATMIFLNLVAWYEPGSLVRRRLLGMAMLVGWMPTPALALTPGEHAPEPRVQDLGGAMATLDWDGHPSLMSVGATWCAPCITEFPHIETLASELIPSGLDVVVVLLPPVDRASPWLQELAGHGIRIVVATPSFERAFDLSSVPLNVLISSSGTITTVHEGFVADAFPLFAKEVRSLVLTSRRPSPLPSPEITP